MRSVKRFAQRANSSLLFLPTLGVIVGMLLAAGTLAIDTATEGTVGPSFLFRGSASTARSLLGSIVSATITLTGLVFSITMLVLQLTSSQYSPRALRTFLSDRNSQLTLAVFAGTFTYAMAVLRTLDGTTSQPGLSMSVSVLLVLVTVAVFIQYINHMATAIRPSTIIGKIASDAERSCDTFLSRDPRPIPEDLPPLRREIATGEKGRVETTDVSALVDAACASDGVIVVLRRHGEFVPRGAAVLEVRGGGEWPDGDELARHVHLSPVRIVDIDPSPGLRRLVDIAERALSPGTNDPTTAVEAVNEIRSVLRRLGPEQFPSGAHADANGVVRVVLPEPTWSDLLDLAFDEVYLYGRESLQIRHALTTMLADIASVVTPERLSSVEAKQALLDALPPLLPLP